MPEPQILYQTEDEFGEVIVLDDDEQRTLAFAEGDAQSCILKTAPHIPQYEYMQAMLTVLLFCQPKRVMMLGLGGGNLMTALHHHIGGIHVTAVESRQSVIDVAYRYFQLPRGKKMQVIKAEACTFLEEYQGRNVDVLFADLYHAKGAEEGQLQADFITQCAGKLKTGGWLVLNYWTEHQENAAFIDTLHNHFKDIRTVLTGSKNWVVLAGLTEDTQSTAALKTKAARLSPALGFQLNQHLRNMQPLMD